MVVEFEKDDSIFEQESSTFNMRPVDTKCQTTIKISDIPNSYDKIVICI